MAACDFNRRRRYPSNLRAQPLHPGHVLADRHAQPVRIVPVAQAPRQVGEFLALFRRHGQVAGVAAHHAQRVDELVEEQQGVTQAHAVFG